MEELDGLLHLSVSQATRATATTNIGLDVSRMSLLQQRRLCVLTGSHPVRVGFRRRPRRQREPLLHDGSVHHLIHVNEVSLSWSEVRVGQYVDVMRRVQL